MTFYRWKGLPPHNRLVPRQLFSPCNHPLLFVIPTCPGVPWDRTRISYFTALASDAYVVLLKENHMQLIEAATLDRKSGAGTVGPWRDLQFTSPATNPSWKRRPPHRHPACPGEPWERSASQICRITKGL